MSEKLQRILNGMGNQVKSFKDEIGKLDDKIKGIVLPIMEEFKSKFEVGLETIRSELKQEYDNKFWESKNDLIQVFADEKKVILNEIQEIIDLAKQELQEVF